MDILHELLVGEMNFRKLFLWAWAMVMLCMLAFIVYCVCGIAWEAYGFAAYLRSVAVVQVL